MKRAEVNAKLQQAMVSSAEMAHRREAEQKIFQAAAFINDGAAMQASRERLHALLDQEFDILASAMSLSRLLILATD